MQEGSMRCDVNISLRPKGQEQFGVRSEIKNLNSFNSVTAAIAHEYDRQAEILAAGGVVEQETRHFDADSGETTTLRGKENADDYRYFPEPDIIPVVIPGEVLSRLRDGLPELPDKKLRRYVGELGVPEADARMLTKYRRVSEYFEEAAAGLQNPKTAATFMVTQMFGMIPPEAEREHWSPKVTAAQLSELLKLLESDKLSRNLAKRVFSQMLESGRPATDFITEQDLAGFDPAQLSELCMAAVAENPKSVADYRAGREKAIKALVGAVMRASKGRADALAAEAMLKKMIED
jgi:aspartyl-tRNA(Asn)/glutamyl-tRNA(Gln) amidotransferase subunit B